MQTNLATLIGTTNYQMLLNINGNDYVVLDDFKVLENTSNIDHSKVVGLGSFDNCQRLSKYLQGAQNRGLRIALLKDNQDNFDMGLIDQQQYQDKVNEINKIK